VASPEEELDDDELLIHQEIAHLLKEMFFIEMTPIEIHTATQRALGIVRDYMAEEGLPIPDSDIELIRVLGQTLVEREEDPDS
jgi:hypothetical protein